MLTKFVVTIRPHEIPDYAAHCDGDKFSKACSCISVYPSKRCPISVVKSKCPADNPPSKPL